MQFKHGIEEKVMAEDMEIMVSEAHHEGEHEDEKDKPKTKTDLMAAMNGMMKKANGMKKMELEKLHAAMMNYMGGHEDDEEDDDMNEAIKELSLIHI